MGRQPQSLLATSGLEARHQSGPNPENVAKSTGSTHHDLGTTSVTKAIQPKRVGIVYDAVMELHIQQVSFETEWQPSVGQLRALLCMVGSQSTVNASLLCAEYPSWPTRFCLATMQGTKNTQSVFKFLTRRYRWLARAVRTGMPEVDTKTGKI